MQHIMIKDILTRFAEHMEIVDCGSPLPTTNIILGCILRVIEAGKVERKIEAQRLHIYAKEYYVRSSHVVVPML
jgi:hypothetical protein